MMLHNIHKKPPYGVASKSLVTLDIIMVIEISAKNTNTSSHESLSMYHWHPFQGSK